MKRWDAVILALIVLLHIVLYGVFVGDEWVKRSLEREHAMNHALFGPELTEHAYSRARRWFETLFEAPGVVANSYRVFIPDADARANSDAIEGLGHPFFVWFEERLQVFWTLVYQTLIRLSVTELWLPYALFLFVPWVVDGLVQRRIKQAGFANTSPLRFAASQYVIFVLLVIFFLMVFAPFAMSPWVTPAFLVAASFGCGLLLGNTSQRL